MNKETFLRNSLPTYSGCAIPGSKWLPLVVMCKQITDDGKLRYGYGKLLYCYADDFCGGIQIRSVYVHTQIPRFDSSWGWCGAPFNLSMDDSCPDIDDAMASAGLDNSAIPLIPTDVDIEELMHLALACRLFSFSQDSRRNGVMGLDRVEDSDYGDESEGGVYRMLQNVVRVSGWSNFEQKAYSTDVHNYTVAKFRQSMPKVLNVSSFLNFNSERQVANITAYSPMTNDDYWAFDDYDDFREAYYDYTFVEFSSRVEHSNLKAVCPTVEWCVG